MSTRGEKNTVSPPDESRTREALISATGKRRILGHAPYLAIIILVTFVPRIVPYTGSAFFNGNAVVVDPDACYHLRRAELFRHNLPQLPIFDSYLNHPQGAFPIWAPLYDLSLAGLWSLLDLSGLPSPLTGLLFLPPILMALACALIYRIGLSMWPDRKWLACGAALVPAVLPLTVSYSYLGNLDHHAAEMLCVVLFLSVFISNLTVLLENRRTRNVLSLGWRPGLVLGLGLLVEHGLLILEPLILLCLIVLYLRWRKASLWLWGGVIHAVAGLVILPFGLYNTLQGIHFTHSHFCLFHPLILLGAVLFFLTFWLAVLPSERLGLGYRILAISMGTTLVLFLAAVLLHEVVAGASYLAGSASGWMATIGETTSFFRLTPKQAVGLLSSQVSLLVFLLPIFWCLFLCMFLLHRRELKGPHWVLLCSSIIFTAIGLQQIRFLPYMALMLGLVVAFLLEALVRRLSSVFQVLVIASVLIIGFVPCFGEIGAKDLMSMTEFEDVYPVLQWLRQESPPTSHYLHPDETAEYGVLAEWSLGHYIKYYSHRPVLADNFSTHAADLGRINQFFFATDNDEAYALLDVNKVRYILCRDLPSMYQGMIFDPSMLEYVSDFDPKVSRIVFNPKIYPTVLCRLAWRYGGAFIDRENGIYYPPLDRMRLVAESKKKDETMPAPEVAQIKLFEYVPGVRLKVTGLPPDAGVALSAKIITPYGRTFPYVQLLESDKNGHLSATLPYPNEKKRAAYAKEYSLILGDRKKPLPNVTEQMVREGLALEVGWD